MKLLDDVDPPLVKGGQGHDAGNVLDTGRGCMAGMGVMLALAVVSGLVLVAAAWWPK